jgi:MurNAc alpha-1-phosphate uridylyltransferase
VHHARAAMEDHLAGRVHLSVEAAEPLGTAGALGRLREWVDGRAVVVANSDTWADDDLATLVRGWDGERIRLLVIDEPARGDFGRWRFAGVSLMPWSAVRVLEPVPSGLYEVCWRSAYAAGRLDLAATDRRAIDCGTPADYLAANLAASGGRSVIGAGAVVEGTLERSVVWPGGRVHSGEHLVDAIRAGSQLTVYAGGSAP